MFRADFIIMPCNTAHIWLDELKRNSNVPFSSLIKNTSQHLLKLKASRNAHFHQNTLVNSSYRIVVRKVDEL